MGAHRVGKLQLPGLRLEHDVQATALEVRAVGSTSDLGEGRGWAERTTVGSAVTLFPPCVSPGAGAHLTKAATAWHPGLNVKLPVGREAQFLGGHVQDPAATVKDKVKVSG